MKNFKIIDFQERHQSDFARLNYEWISKYFSIEEEDRKTLEDPKEKVYKNGGHILLAEKENEIVGTCALIKEEEKVFELAKMAVSPTVQGEGIGYALGISTIQKAKELGAEKIVLETNSVLTPAISLYKKLGFKKVETKESPYCRCDYQMELILD